MVNIILFSLLTISFSVFSDQEWQLEVLPGNGEIREVNWKRGNESIAAMGADLLEIVTQEPVRLKSASGVSYAIVTVPVGKMGGLRGGVALLPPGKTASDELLIKQQPMKDPSIAMNPDGFFYAYAQGDVLRLAFYNVQEMREKSLGANLSLTRKKDGDLQITFTPNEALVQDGGQTISYNQNGEQGQGEYVFTDLTQANKDIIVGEFNCKDLTKMALAGELDVNEEEGLLVQQIVLNLQNRTKPNVILRSDDLASLDGVVYDLVKQIAEEKISEFKGWKVYQMRGSMFETEGLVGITDKKLNRFLGAIRQKKVILYMPQLEKYIGLGSSRSSDSSDGSSTLVEDLLAGTVKAIGSTTNGSTGIGIIRAKEGFHSAFEEYEMKEPTGEKLFQVVRKAADQMQKKKRVVFSDTSIKQIIDLSTRHLPRQSQPGKALKGISDIAAKAPRERDPKTPPLVVTEVLVRRWIAERTGIQTLAEMGGKEGANSSEGLRHFLKEETFWKQIHSNWIGQPDAKEALYRTLLGVSRETGISQHKNSSSVVKGPQMIMFFGPAGTGKSHAPRDLERLLALHKVSWPYWSIEGSQFKNETGVSALLGASRTYIGFQEGGGSLYSYINDHPEAIIVFEEFDKIHKGVVEALLPFFEYGKVPNYADPDEIAYFRKGIVVLTSNFGMDLINKYDRRRFFGIQDPEIEHIKTVKDLSTEIKKRLVEQGLISSPVQRRIGNFVAMTHLSKDEIREVMELKLLELTSDYRQALGAELRITAQVKAWFMSNVWNEKDGEPAFTEGASSVINLINYQVAPPLEYLRINEGDDRVRDREWLLSIEKGKLNVTLGKEIKKQ